MNNKLKIVTVVNNFEIYYRCIGSNNFLNDYEKIVYDNSNENTGISKRYNAFIEQAVKSHDDFWIAFIHQDFSFNENPMPKLEKLSPDFIYGAVGVWLYKSYSFLTFCRDHTFKIESFFKKNHYRRQYGQIKQNFDQDSPVEGEFLDSPKVVNTLDCCCVILNTRLIKKYHLRFDENLDFHMYSEELCIGAKANHKILSKAIQFDCIHLGKGTLNEEFYKSSDYVREKYGLCVINSTCIQ